MRRSRRSASLLAPLKGGNREDGALMGRLRRDAERIAGHFGLTYRELSPERANVKRRYGVCYADGRIAVRLKHARSGVALKYSSLVNTICHELAHLRHFNHGPRFKAFYCEILDYARREGIYLPGKPRRREWIQMDLFNGLGDPASGLERAAKR